MKKALCEQIKLIAERIAPEAAEDSKKLLQILNKHWRYSDPGELDTEEQDLLKKYDLKFDEGDHDIYPNELETDDKYDSYRRSRYGISNLSLGAKSKPIDLTQMGRKRLQRDKAGSSNKNHYDGRHSDEQKRLQGAVNDAKYDLDVATSNNWEDDKKKAERSLKIRQGKLDRENQRLKNIRKKYSYQNLERERDAERISQNVSDYKDSKREIRWADIDDADFAKDREEETRRFMNRMKEIDDRAAKNDKHRQWHKDRINKLLRRDKKMESMKRYRDIMEQLANVPAEDTASTEKPAYAAAIRDIKEADKKREEYRKIPSAHVEREENPKNPKMAAGAKKLMLDESLFDFRDLEEGEGICPECGGVIDYDVEGEHLVIVDTETAYYNCKCSDCNKHFKEVHNIQLNFSHYDTFDDIAENINATTLKKKSSKLTEKWSNKIDKSIAFKLRDAIENDNRETIIQSLKEVVDYIEQKIVNDDPYLDTIRDDIDCLTIEDDDEQFDYVLGSLYDFLDDNDIWLPIAPLDEAIISKKYLKNKKSKSLKESEDGEKLLPDEFDELYATLDTNPEIEDLYNQNRDADTVDNFYNAVEDRFPNVEFYGYDWKESEEAIAKYNELIAAGYEVTLNPAYEGTDAYGLIAIKSNLNESVIYAKPGKYINIEEGDGVYITVGSNGKIAETSHGKIINDGFGIEINGTKYVITCPNDGELHAYSYNDSGVQKGFPFKFKLAE